MTTGIPSTLGHRFSVADALAAGVPASALRMSPRNGSVWTRPFWGMRAGIDADAAGGDRDAATAAEAAIVERCLDYAQVMPDGAFFSHVSAAVLWGIPLPSGVARRAHDLDVSTFPPARALRRAGITGHESRRALVTVVRHPGLPVRVASPASTWAQLGGILTDPYDLVAAGDAVVRERMFTVSLEPLATPAQLDAVIAAGRRVGAPALRAARPRIVTRSASRPETWCRLTLIDAGMPEPALNWDVYDAAGAHVACVDLAYPDRRVAVEYEGLHHLRDREQWVKDIARHERLARLGWVVVRVTAAQLFDDPAGLVRRVRAARRRPPQSARTSSSPTSQSSARQIADSVE